MVLGPHPDDPESVAVTSRLLMQSGCYIFYAIATVSPSGVDDNYAKAWQGGGPASLLGKKIAIRKKEQRDSAGAFGLAPDRITFLDLNENEKGAPLESSENRAKIKNHLEQVAPDIVIMPVGKDTNRTHAWVHRTFQVCARDLAEGEHRPIVGFYNEDPKTTAINADLFVMFAEESAEWKRALLRLHDSQHQRNIRTRRMGFDRRILGVNRLGYQKFPEFLDFKTAAAGYAEVFEVELFGF